VKAAMSTAARALPGAVAVLSVLAIAVAALAFG
jgi:hypothetical protein